MGWLGENIRAILESLLIGWAVWALAQAIIVLATWCSPYWLMDLLESRRWLRGRAPAGIVFYSRDGSASMLVYDPESNEEKQFDFGKIAIGCFLRWRGKPKKSLAAVRRRIAIDLCIRVSVLVALVTLVLIPSFWLASRQSLVWLFVPGFLLVHQLFVMRTRRLFFIRPGCFFMAFYVVRQESVFGFSPSEVGAFCGMVAIFTIIGLLLTSPSPNKVVVTE
ncbi:hypothetical protein [Actinomadura kijaniata]|uniref:hypothetical protein n=1 Tax=Actinomadura kijaniata TaxID=46161 RepID=UPI0012FCC5AA|nr:hypothetical protein [Actinomadura kijaniata]